MLGSLLSLAAPGFSGEVETDASRTVFAVVTHKGGLAAGQAHNHLVVASAERAQLTFDPETPLEATFELEVATTDLVVDDRETQEFWYPRLEKLGILDEPFSDVSDKDRAKIREAMLSKKQLDSGAFPKIRARIVEISENASAAGGIDFPFTVSLALEVHGKNVEKPVAARYELADDTLRIEAFGTFQFTDFDIKPYSAAFGLVKNLDEFHVYLHLEGRLPESPVEE